MLKLSNIVKNYPAGNTTVHALRGISVEFRESEFVAILGPSGCGKTTMLNIIGGLDRYTSGDLVIGGVSTKDFDEQHWDAYRNATIGFVFQSYNLIPQLTVLENIEVPLYYQGIITAESQQRCRDLAIKVGLSQRLGHRSFQLSGGQQQRVGIARSLINNPAFLLADEPTGNLDTATTEEIMSLLKELNAEGKTIIIVTHEPEVGNQTKRIIRLKDGEVVEDTGA